jgi:hypothetical protein
MSHNQEAPQGNGDSARRINRFWRAVLWVTVVVLAVAPYPWWW